MVQTFIDLVHGIIVGFLISLPLGPVALITMKRAAEFGLRAGILSGLAIVVIDSVAAIGILLGLYRTLPYIRPLPPWIHLLGALIIFFYGLRLIFSDPVRTIAEALPWHKHFFGSMLIALTTPSTYVSFGVIGFLLSRFLNNPFYSRITVGVGFFVGALLWWTTLAIIAFKQRDRYRNANYMHRAIGFIIMLLAILMLLPIHVKAFAQLSM